jgi:hypothetical protein
MIRSSFLGSDNMGIIVPARERINKSVPVNEKCCIHCVSVPPHPPRFRRYFILHPDFPRTFLAIRPFFHSRILEDRFVNHLGIFNETILEMDTACTPLIDLFNLDDTKKCLFL